MDSAVQNAGDIAVTQSQYVAPHLSRLGSGGNIDKTAKDFEGMFMSQMLQPMFEGMNVDKTFGGGNGEKIMRGMLVQEYGKIASKGTHLGIADAVKSEMIRAQNATSKTSGGTAGAISSANQNAYQSNGGLNAATP